MSQLSHTRLVLMSLLLATLLAACTPVSCSKQSKDFITKMEALFDDWDDSTNLASHTARIALSPVIAQMQSIRRQVNDLKAPQCAKHVQDELMAYMDKSIESYTAFMDNDSGKADRLAQEAAGLFEKFIKDFMELKYGNDVTAPPKPNAPPLPPTTIPGTPTPEGWTRHETPRLILWLPATWTTLEVDQGDLNDLFAEFQAHNPDLAGIIGGPESLQGVYLWAFDNTGADPTVNNLNIRRSELGSSQGADMELLVGSIVGQYRQLGFDIEETLANLNIGGFPAARIAYSFAMTNSAGQAITAKGYQYLVAAGANLWILSYTIDPALTAAVLPVIEQSAESFQAK